MKIKPLISIFFAASACLSFAGKKPNFIIILTDDQGYGDLSCFGGKHVSTPRIDQMAKEGARLTNFYVTAPICTPSRASLMTGCYADRVGMNSGVCLAGDLKGLNPDEVTIAEVARSAGYKTAMFGKWHLGDQPEFLPTRQGFEIFYGLPYSHDIFPRHATRKFPPLPLLNGEKVIELDPDPSNLTKRFTQKAVDFIAENKDSPFFIYLAHPLPHRPIYVSDKFMDDVPEGLKTKVAQADKKPKMGKTRDKLYTYAISEIDWSVGAILDQLKAQGIDENTFVIFTSDNGPKLGSSKPLSGGKGSILEGGMRMPTVVRWPAKIPAGKDNAEIMTTMDLLPTFAKLMGVMGVMGGKAPEGRVIDGKDISATLIEHQKSPHEYFYYIRRGGNVQAVRHGKWKLMRSKKGHILNNLETDVAEKINVAKAHPEIVEKLSAAMKTFGEELKNNTRFAAFVKKAKPLTMHKE